MTPRTDIDKSFFTDGFDAETVIKLDIYADYLQEWLPVPLSGRMGAQEAVIYDLFCGPGSDGNGKFGSPLRAIDVVTRNEATIQKSNVPVRLVFNDYDEDHISALQSAVGDVVASEDGVKLATVEYHNRPFQEVFPELIDAQNERTASFFFIDQFGATSVGAAEFQVLHSLRSTDVLFYIASNWFRRFSDRPEAAKWEIDKDEIMQVDYRLLHRFMVEQFKAMVGNDYFVAPFSLKKMSNIYGLIFASHNSLGLEKFLNVAWRKDPYTGEASYDLFGESADDKSQVQLFDADKVTSFQTALRAKILAGDFATDKDIYIHMLESGFINRHAKPVVSELASKRHGLIEFRRRGQRVQARLSRKCIKEPSELVLLT